MLLEDVLRLHLPWLYHGYEIRACHAIRVTRDADIEVPRGRAGDLLDSIEASLRERRMGDAVRLQYDADLPAGRPGDAGRRAGAQPEDLYHGAGFTAFSDLFQLYAAIDLPRLKDRPLAGPAGAGLRESHPTCGRRSGLATSSSTIRISRSTW